MELFFRDKASQQPMELFFRGLNEDSSAFDWSFAHQDIHKCPFLRNINEPTSISFSSPMHFPMPIALKSAQGKRNDLLCTRVSSAGILAF